MQPKNAKKPSDKIVFFDLECEQTTGIHRITHAVAQGLKDSSPTVFKPSIELLSEGKFEEAMSDTANRFCAWIFSMDRFKKFTFIAHNGKGYDFHFILRWAIDHDLEIQSLLREGSKIKYMQIEKVRFVDSLCYLCMPLSKFPKTFGFSELKKGYFPHFFNTPPNQVYVGLYPERNTYGYECMLGKSKEEFMKWHDSKVLKKEVFDLQKEIVEYCISDVDILRKGCMLFRELFIKESGVDPFQYTTIASACMAVYRSRYLEENTLAILYPKEASFIRRSFCGGRTNVMKALHELPENCTDRINYVDITSLYPWVNSKCEYPIGEPTEKVYDPPLEAESEYATSQDFEIHKILSDSFGFIEVDVVAPNDLYHPVLPLKKAGKLIFGLDPIYKGVFCTEELKKAVEKGYIITKVYRVLSWSKKVKGIFSKYVYNFLKIKQEASGWKAKTLNGKQVETLDEKEEWIKYYSTKEGVTLEIDKVNHNPGLRALAKICLNSLWGKMAQRTNPVQSKIVSSIVEVLDLLDKKIVQDMYNVGEGDMTEILYTEKDVIEGERESFQTNMALAAFTTAHARLRLYEALETVGENALYCDTDSVVYLQTTDKPLIPLGDCLGEWTDEVGGEIITGFVALAPKTYSYRTTKGTECVKAKGFRIHGISKSVLNYDNYVKLLKNEEGAQGTVIDPVFITRDKYRKELVNVYNRKKRLRSTLHQKGNIQKDNRIYPFGYIKKYKK
jgi:hypothetical protein